MDFNTGFPRQKLPYTKKTKAWGRSVVDWGCARTYFNYAPVRKDVMHMQINFDLLNGKVHMRELASYLNPDEASAVFPPEKIQHYPIMNEYLMCLRGEASARVFDWRAVVTNPNSISEMEVTKREQFKAAVQSIIEDTSISDDEANKQMQDTVKYFTYEWQDAREIRANEVLKHYTKEQNHEDIYLDGFMDAMAVGEEAYQCDIIGGEPWLIKLNPRKLRIYMNGYSNHIEDADVIIYEDWLPRGRIYDMYYDALSEKDRNWLEEMPSIDGGDDTTPEGAVNDAYGLFKPTAVFGEEGTMVEGDDVGFFFDAFNDFGSAADTMPYDVAGNIRVVRVYWKSRRKIKKVTRIDPETGQEDIDFYPETYITDEAAGETEEVFWVNEPWEGTKIGENIYVNIRPRVVRYNSMSNPSRCHFGIFGTIYNLNENKPYSLVDMMKPYNYLYDAVSHQLVELIATNWGKIVEMDLAFKPKNWEVPKWIIFMRRNKVLIKDSFNEGNKGAAMGKLAAGLNNASKGVIDASWGDDIQYFIGLLDNIDMKMGKLIGMTPQRMGQIQNRETLGGVERSTLQSSYTTDWLFQKHSDTIRRGMTIFLETAKAAFRGRIVKFRYIMSDGSIGVMSVDGDLFAESDYGILIDQSNETQMLVSRIDTIAQAMIQNGADASAVMKIFSSRSISEKIHILEDYEKKAREQAQEQQKMEMQQAQQIQAMQNEAKRLEMEFKDRLNQRDNDTKIRMAEINAEAEYLRLGVYAEENDEEILKEKLEIEREKMRNDIQKLDKEIRFEEKKYKDEIKSKEKIAKYKNNKAQ